MGKQADFVEDLPHLKHWLFVLVAAIAIFLHGLNTQCLQIDASYGRIIAKHDCLHQHTSPLASINVRKSSKSIDSWCRDITSRTRTSVLEVHTQCLHLGTLKRQQQREWFVNEC